MAAVEEDHEALNKTLQSALTQSRALVSTVDRLRQENQSLQQQLRNALAAKLQDEPGKSHISVPATQLNTPPVSGEMALCYTNLLEQNHEQVARIEFLTGLLRQEREKSKNWRLQYNITSSPASGSPQCTPVTSLVQPKNFARTGLHEPHIPLESKTIDESCTRVSASPEALEEKAQTVHIKVEALQETTGNSRKRRKISSTRGAEAIPAIAEDGEDHNRKRSSSAATLKSSDSTQAPATAHRRLGNLLAEPTPPRPRLLGPDAFIKPGRSAVDQGPPRKPRFLKPRPRKDLDAEDGKPLRARPLLRLTLQHFKINPHTNEGLDYAYQDVVRNHHARKCLSGCTDRCCVDKFRALARTLYDADNRGDETLDQQISNNSLLLDMLGSGSEEKIRTLTPAARANLVEEARVREMSARYSRHRAAHPRTTSPPGFWDADMPGTQENAENREKANRLEREEVERRYRDAMKGGGRWMFGDE